MSDAPTATDATMAVFLDLENIALGAKEANFPRFDIKLIFERLLLRGHIVVKKAYCDFERYKDFKRDLHQSAFELIDVPHLNQSGKNSADIRMVVDALDLCYTNTHVDTFVILSGDSDFSPLVSKLRENGKVVIGVGVKKSSSGLFINNCDLFMYYDDFARRKAKPPAAPKPPKPANNTKPDEGPSKEEAFEQLLTTLSALVEERGEDDVIYGSMIKPAIKRQNPGFSESAHGFNSFNDLLKAAEKAGLVKLETDGKSRNFTVRLTRPA